MGESPGVGSCGQDSEARGADRRPEEECAAAHGGVADMYSSVLD